MLNSNEFEMQLHERLLARDPVASEEVARLFLEAVRRHVSLRAQVHGVFDHDLINDAAVDAVFDYIRRPDKFSPVKSSLRTYLKLAAERDLINAVRKDRRRRRGEELSGDVELAVVSGNKGSEIERILRDPDDALFKSATEDESLDEVVEMIGPGSDQVLVRMMMDGERRTSAFAEVLGISNLPVPEQRRTVKQHKDRLKQQLKRAGGKRRG
jgi:RNA polymerase sigma factor (sigma-70 family)